MLKEEVLRGKEGSNGIGGPDSSGGGMCEYYPWLRGCIGRLCDV